MAERGEYRSIHVAMADDPDFLRLSPQARLTLLMLKLTLGPSGINVVRAMVPELAVLTGYGDAEVRAALDELVRDRWIRIEHNVIWIRNGLRFEPSLSLASENTVKGVCRHLRSLPRLRIVNDFAAYYNLPIPFPELESDEADSSPRAAPLAPSSEGPSNPLRTPFEAPSKQGRRDEGEGRREISSQPLFACAPAREEVAGEPTAAPAPGPAAMPGDLEAQITAVIVAANQAMTRNPALDQQRLKPIPATGSGRQDVLEWIREGIPIEVILEVVEDVALRYRPDGHNRQISAMSYFTPAIRERHELRMAKESGTHGDRTHDRRSQAKGRGGAPANGRRRPGKYAAVTVRSGGG
jgi:hypothetical protein